MTSTQGRANIRQNYQVVSKSHSSMLPRSRYLSQLQGHLSPHWQYFDSDPAGTRRKGQRHTAHSSALETGGDTQDHNRPSLNIPSIDDPCTQADTSDIASVARPCA